MRRDNGFFWNFSTIIVPGADSDFQKMAAILGCGVAIDTDRGQLTIDYHNLGILQGVLSKLGLDEV